MKFKTKLLLLNCYIRRESRLSLFIGNSHQDACNRFSCKKIEIIIFYCNSPGNFQCVTKTAYMLGLLSICSKPWSLRLIKKSQEITVIHKIYYKYFCPKATLKVINLVSLVHSLKTVTKCKGHCVRLY